MDYVKSYKWIGIVLVLAILAVSFTYQVAEGEQAIQYTWGVMKKIIVDPDNDYVDDLDPDTLKRLGNVEIVKDKGLRFKIPFVHKVVKYDSRLLTYINQPEVINTLEKKQYLFLCMHSGELLTQDFCYDTWYSKRQMYILTA